MTTPARDVSLEFANTVDWHAGSNPEERLTGYVKAVEWAEREGVLSEGQARRLMARAQAHPAQQTEALQRIIAFREAIYRLFSAVSHRGRPIPQTWNC